jgi:GNAT superfamily N-acetyltransferase
MTVRIAALGDEPRIAALAAQLGYPSGAQQVLSRLKRIQSDPTHRVYVADLPETGVAGWIHFFLYKVVESDLRLEIAALVVDETCRVRGVGKALMARAEEWAREHGCQAVSLRSNVVRQEAHEFYQGLGYTILKTQHAFRKILSG